MLGPIRKFSTTIFAKILLAIIIIPFVFWGMGSAFKSGNKDIIVVINKDKFSIQEFVNFIQVTSATGQKISSNNIDELLSNFIGDRLIQKEVDYFNINLSDKSLSQLIKVQKNFQRNGKFSRAEYEKFLLKNNITAVDFESNLSRFEKKRQLLDFIGGIIIPPKFLVNNAFDKINQKRIISFINLNDVIKKKYKFSKEEVEIFHKNNSEKFIEIFKSVFILELNTKNLVNSDEFNDLFFKKIDEIDDLLIQGQDFESIITTYDLKKPDPININIFGLNKKLEINKNLSKNLIKKIFTFDESMPPAMIEDDNKYYIVKVNGTEKIIKKLTEPGIEKKIIQELEKIAKRKFTSVLIDKINKNNFNKSNFDDLSKKENIEIKKIKLNGKNDNKTFKAGIIEQIYSFPEKKVIVVNDIGLVENYLVYVNEIENKNIDEKSDEYIKYQGLSKIKITSDLYNTYDNYIKKRYKIDINYKAVDTVKNYFN